MNDITGSDIRCPQCKTTFLQPMIVSDNCYFICG